MVPKGIQLAKVILLSVFFTMSGFFRFLFELKKKSTILGLISNQRQKSLHECVGFFNLLAILMT